MVMLRTKTIEYSALNGTSVSPPSRPREHREGGQGEWAGMVGTLSSGHDVADGQKISTQLGLPVIPHGGGRGSQDPNLRICKVLRRLLGRRDLSLKMDGQLVVAGRG